MLTKTEAEARVAKGAAHLDTVRPNWFNEIDVGRLTLSSCERCVLGQFSGLKERYDDDEAPFLEGLSLIGLMSDDDAAINAVATAHGFAITSGDPLTGDDYGSTATFALLQDAWIAAIADRKLAQDAVSEPVVAHVHS